MPTAARRQRYLDNGLCADCGSKPHLPDYTLCQMCRWKKAISQKEYTKRDYIRQREYFRNLRQARKAQGRCTRCGQELLPEDGDHVECNLCNGKRTRGGDPIENQKRRKAYAAYRKTCSSGL